ncbi:hypothetical protein [Falseniella ignava]|uniref:Uncharacterized protein n=2 Tax=Falseniella ignava TaxID=137730 RepID=K1MCC8_9LACT|nr:hypothetical protein [Falseniella ignava]EKB53679.1 hypothetical protein HMPREF9707_01432 [Falseniella ignava CCUG 37419]PKY87877.1 hypothetical protein CYJ57_06415 [Falseniella ignava]
MNPNNSNEYEKRRRLLMVYLVISLIVQIIILGCYYFLEKQVLLTFPMLLGIFITIATFPVIKSLK